MPEKRTAAPGETTVRDAFSDTERTILALAAAAAVRECACAGMVAKQSAAAKADNAAKTVLHVRARHRRPCS